MIDNDSFLGGRGGDRGGRGGGRGAPRGGRGGRGGGRGGGAGGIKGGAKVIIVRPRKLFVCRVKQQQSLMSPVKPGTPPTRRRLCCPWRQRRSPGHQEPHSRRVRVRGKAHQRRCTHDPSP